MWAKRKEIVVPFYEKQLILQAQKNPKNIGRLDHELLLKIEEARKQLKLAKGKPEKQAELKRKIEKLESKKTIVRSPME